MLHATINSPLRSLDFPVKVAFASRSYHLCQIAESERLYLVMLVVDTYDMMITAELTSMMFNIQCSPETTDCGKTLNRALDS